MGFDRIALALLALTWLHFCGADEPEAEAELPPLAGDVEVEGPPGAPSVEVVLPEPVAGGTMVAVGPHPLEVAPYEDGTVVAYVRSPEPPPPASTQITVRVPTDSGASQPVLLAWDPSAASYRGRLRGAAPRPGPVEVTVVVGGERYLGARPRLVVVGPAPPPAAVVEVEAPPPEAPPSAPPPPRAGVEVRAPRPPRPRVQVEIDAPRPPRHEVTIRHGGPPRPSVRVSKRRGRVRGRRHRRGRRVRVRVRD